MLKISKRHNVIYIIQLIISSVLRTTVKFIIGWKYEFNNSLTYTFLMFLGECLTGIVIYKYQSKYMKQKETIIKALTASSNASSQLEKENVPNFKNLKIYSLLFMAAFFDFFEFSISALYLKKYKNISLSLESRFYGVLAMSNTMIYKYLLKIPILKHQRLSIFIILSCFLIILIVEFCFQRITIFFTYGDFIEAILLILAKYFFLSIMDIIDKYLMEYESYYQFNIIIVEGGIGAILTILYSFIENPFKDLNNVFNTESSSSLFWFIFLLFLFFFLSGVRNAFRIMTNKLYSPMVLTLSDNIFNPIDIIISYVVNDDFNTGEGQNIFYFIINLIMSLIITLSTFIYNEFVVLFFCGLETDTHDQIAKRAKNEWIEMSNSRLISKNKENNENKENNGEEQDGIYVIYV